MTAYKELPDHKARRWLYVGVAKEFKKDPLFFRNKGLEKLVPMSKNMHQKYTDEWTRLLTKGHNNTVIEVLVKKGEPFESLRQTCPLIHLVSKKYLMQRKAKWKNTKSKNY